MSYCVYEHIFPNGKKYIGISGNAEKRWRNGNGYENQRKIANAIRHYGWDNVTHNIIVDGLDKEQAQTIEKYLIAELDTIRNGYNTDIGGGCGNGTYLNEHMLEMINHAKHMGISGEIIFGDGVVSTVELADEDRYDKRAAEFWNEACEAVERKHGRKSATDHRDLDEFWYYVSSYYSLWLLNESGADISQWEEKSYERAVYDYYFG